MDPRNQNQDHQSNHAMRDTFAFNSTHNDTFNSFLHPDTDSSFNTSWDPETFADPQESINGFNQSNHSWNQNTLQPSNLLSTQNYGVQTRNLDQTFSGNPSAFNYPGFDSRPNLTIPTSTFNPNIAYGQLPLNDDGSFGFSAAPNYQRVTKPSETISPQALENYPATFNHVQIPEARPVCSPSRSSNPSNYDNNADVALNSLRSILPNPLHLRSDFLGADVCLKLRLPALTGVQSLLRFPKGFPTEPFQADRQ